MKKYFIILLIFISSCSPSDTATESQRSWCYANANLGEDNDFIFLASEETNKYYQTLRDARDLFENDTGITFNISILDTKIENGSENALKLCKIWADINQVD